MTARPEVPIFVGKHWTFASEMRLGRFYVLRHNELPACMKLELYDRAQHWRWEIDLVDEHDVKILHTWGGMGIEALVGQMRVINAVISPGARCVCVRHADCVKDRSKLLAANFGYGRLTCGVHRDCHLDLALGHACLQDRLPYMFDTLPELHPR